MFDTNFWQATTIIQANICFYEANVKAGVVYKIKSFLDHQKQSKFHGDFSKVLNPIHSVNSFLTCRTC